MRRIVRPQAAPAAWAGARPCLPCRPVAVAAMALRGGPAGRPLALALALGLLAGAASAQVSNTLVLAPFASVTETVTDNYKTTDTREGDAVTRMTGGLSLRGRGTAVEGSADYGLSQVLYARHSGDNVLQHDLNSRLHGQWWENRLTLDASASVGRRSASAFGVSTGNDDSANSNRVEQRSWRVAPGLRGVIGPDVAYDSQLSYAETRLGGGTVGDNRVTQGTLHVGPNRSAVLSLAGDYQHVTTAYRHGGRTTSVDRLYGTAAYVVTPLDLRLSANAGLEYSNLLTLDRRRYDTWGLGLQWTPSPRTRIDGSYDNRPFGGAHRLLGEYRIAGLALRLSSTRDVVYGSAQEVPAAASTALSQLFVLLASVQPDPLQRVLLARDLLVAAGQPLNEPLDARYLTGAASLQTRQEFNLTYTRLRETFVLSLARSSAQRTDPLSQLLDEVVANPRLRTTTASLGWSHPLTVDSSLLAQLSGSLADSGSTNQHSRQWQATLAYDVQLGRHVRASVGLRHGQYQLNGASGYSENALTATLGARY